MSDREVCPQSQHKYEARYDEQPADVFAYGFNRTKRTYVRDICVRCGKTVERSNGEGAGEPMSDVYPVVILQDRYSGAYSGGAWIAIYDWDAPVGDGLRTRLGVVYDGAHGDDITAANWADSKPDWVAVGNTPDEALRNLEAKVKP